MPTNLWQKGKSANPAGKPKGPNKATVEVREFCRSLLQDPQYTASLTIRLYKGALAPQIEALIWQYAYGKPKETIELSGEDGAPLRVVFGGRHKPTLGE